MENYPTHDTMGRSGRESAARRHPILIGCISLIGIGFILMVFIGIVYGPSTNGNLAVVEINGIIFDSDKTLKELDDYRKDDAIRAVVLRIDSPGGEVAPSQEIYESVKKLDSKKPVIASMAGTAASGGYYIALGARKIVANPGTITGSIGVIIEIPNFEGLLKLADIKHEIIKSGPYKDIGSPLRAMTDEERGKLQSFVDDVYNQFVDAVTERRKIDRTEVFKLANGMIYTGRQALGLKLIDKLGTIDDAIKIAAKEGGIEGEPEVLYPTKPTLIEKLFEGEVDSIEKLLPGASARVMYLFKL